MKLCSDNKPNKSQLTFKDLTNGDVFKFVPSSLPWRTYKRFCMKSTSEAFINLHSGYTTYTTPQEYVVFYPDACLQEGKSQETR